MHSSEYTSGIFWSAVLQAGRASFASSRSQCRTGSLAAAIYATPCFPSLPSSIFVRQFLRTVRANSHTHERLTLILLNKAVVSTSVDGLSEMASGTQ